MTPEERELFDLRGREALKYAAVIAYLPENRFDELHTATISLVRVDARQFGITNDHVIQGLDELVATGLPWSCRVNGYKIDPYARLISRSKRLDIAVLDLDGINESELQPLTAKFGTHFCVANRWPPHRPSLEDLVMLGGYPRALREKGQLDRFLHRSVSMTAARVDGIYEDRVRCRLDPGELRLESDRPQETEVPDFPGISGGPVLSQQLKPCGRFGSEMFAIIQEYHVGWDVMYLSPLWTIRRDGTLLA